MIPFTATCRCGTPVELRRVPDPDLPERWVWERPMVWRDRASGRPHVRTDACTEAA